MTCVVLESCCSMTIVLELVYKGGKRDLRVGGGVVRLKLEYESRETAGKDVLG